SDALRPYVIAGPLCFAGDIVARNVLLPRIEEGDFIIIRDTGAYTLSMWSRYNSRQMPKVVGYRDDGALMTILKQRETVHDIIAFWS
ncbi:MAG TPA: diaminopimelate decarboxylase, partial [Thermoanaerobaculia bacterium]